MRKPNHLTTEEYKTFLAEQKSKAKRKGKDHYRAKFAATPAQPLVTAEVQQQQRALFERHDPIDVSIRLPLPPSANTYWQSWVRPGSTRAMVHVGNEGQAFQEAWC